MTKRITLSFLTLCFALTTMAEPIGRQAALYTAQAYMLAKGKSLDEQQTTVNRQRSKASPTGETEDGQPYYYVFNAGNDGGYVIVSGDDRTEPILGYVEQGTFDPDNIPENMRSWLQSYADQIKYIIDNDIQPGSPLIKKRNKVQGTRHSVPELLTTRWNQGHPYNLTCPKYYKGDGTQDYPATGCTATAMAQVINFYKYPAATKIEIPALSKTYNLDDGTTATSTTPAIPANTPIDWENLRDTYNCSDSHEHDATEYAVANLMLMCGQAVRMNYGASSSANFDADVFIDTFGFDDGAFRGDRNKYGIDEWFDLLYNDISEGYPVCFVGFSSGGGHSFVLDGFDGDNLFHVNWGWGGGSNGWFLVSILNPHDNSGIGSSSSSDGYSMGQYALFNLRLPDNVTAEPTTELTINNVQIVDDTKIKASYINWTGSTNSFRAGIVKLNNDGTLSQVGTVWTLNDFKNNTYYSLERDINGKLSQGTYKLSPASRLTSSSVWRPKYNMKNEYIEAVVDADGVPTLRFVTPVESLSIDAIEFPGNLAVGQEQEIKVTFRNNGDEFNKEVRLFASKTNEKVYSGSRSMVAVRAGETVEVSYFFKPTETGTYHLWLCTESDGTGEVGTGTMEVVEASQAVQANLAVTSYTVDNAVGGTAYGNCLIGKANIKNNALEDFHGKVKLQIWKQPNSAGTAWSGSSYTYDVDITAGSIASIDFEFYDLNVGNKYWLSAKLVNQSGTFANSGVWDLGGWEMKSGIVTWNTGGTIAGKAYSNAITLNPDICGLYADCDNIASMTPNSNPNTIYAFSTGMTVPSSLSSSNTVSGNTATSISLVNDKAFYAPLRFMANNATFTYTFPQTERGTGWHAFTLPFKPTDITIDGTPVSLDDEQNHFWIYEFAAQGDDDDEVIFEPVTNLRGYTPYIIAADFSMAGRSITFSATDAVFYKTGSDKIMVSSPLYKFHGTTLAPEVKDCYVLNAEGTAFEYVTTNTTMTGLSAYFTTSLTEGLRPTCIVLPEVPLHATILDENSSQILAGGAFSQVTLKRTFAAGWNTLCLPFAIDDVEAFLGTDARAYEFTDYVGGVLAFSATLSTSAGVPYVVYVPEAITDDIILSDIVIDAAADTDVNRNGACFRGTYAPVAPGEWTKNSSTDLIYGLTTDGKIRKAGSGASIKGFRAYFDLPAGAEVKPLNFEDDATGITSSFAENVDGTVIYNISGQRIQKMQNGINIINGKKILK